MRWDSRPDVAGQMLAAVYVDATFRSNGGAPDDAVSILHKTVNDSVAYGMKYLEIYQKDVVSLPAEITYAHSALLGGSVPPAGGDRSERADWPAPGALIARRGEQSSTPRSLGFTLLVFDDVCAVRIPTDFPVDADDSIPH